MSNTPQQNTQDPSTIPLEQVPIDNLPTAVNLLYAYLDRANKRGAFGLQESAKVMQCLAVVGSVARVIDEQSEMEERNRNVAQVDAEALPKSGESNTTVEQGVRKKS